MDWVQQLPYDVVATVFSHSSFQACVICTRVCKAWRRFLLEHSDAMWTDMTMTTPSEDAREDYKASWLVWLSRAKGNRVRRFELYIKSRRLAVEALELMAFSKWNRLETLRLVGRIPSLG
ncbi:hypothetical protein BCR43DRAFT_492987 [Syncephalastrum racemosum]|uniref:F-box domain-containing protein n=1 Tax=Syncephalastrum racemosum TaxID=13706 RepID=A0A1X2H9V4_SYNRA|nr:hypothetical protein BCR43DRAFT_492987 [Syncephalastrum racemosum]